MISQSKKKESENSLIFISILNTRKKKFSVELFFSFSTFNFQHFPTYLPKLTWFSLTWTCSCVIKYLFSRNDWEHTEKSKLPKIMRRVSISDVTNPSKKILEKFYFCIKKWVIINVSNSFSSIIAGCWHSEHHQSNSRSPGHYGDYLCDSPWSLLESATQAMKDKQGDNVEFVLWTGWVELFLDLKLRFIM